MLTIGVLLSGCGVKDGSEIHEATLTLAAISRMGNKYICMAPHIPQATVINHYEGKVSEGEQRNVIYESARIARGVIKEMSTVSMKDLDAIVLPGGMGAVTNLCNFATNGVDCDIDEQVVRILREALKEGKPIGAMCIAPVVVARAFKGAVNVKIKLTIGDDPQTAKAIETMGMAHENRSATEICVDVTNKVVSTPCYMLAKNITDVEKGTTRLVEEVAAMAL